MSYWIFPAASLGNCLIKSNTSHLDPNQEIDFYIISTLHIEPPFSKFFVLHTGSERWTSIQFKPNFINFHTFIYLNFGQSSVPWGTSHTNIYTIFCCIYILSVILINVNIVERLNKNKWSLNDVRKKINYSKTKITLYSNLSITLSTFTYTIH